MTTREKAEYIEREGDCFDIDCRGMSDEEACPFLDVHGCKSRDMASMARAWLEEHLKEETK